MWTKKQKNQNRWMLLLTVMVLGALFSGILLANDLRTGDYVAGQQPALEKVALESDTIIKPEKKKKTGKAEVAKKREELYIRYLPSDVEVTIWDADLDRPAEIVMKDREAVKAEDVDKVMNRAMVDRLPVFSKDCLGEEDPKACSDEAVQKYIRKNLDYPRLAVKRRASGVQIASFILSDEGRVIEESIAVKAKKEPCPDCSAEVRRVIANMPDWKPAMYKDEAVAVQVVLPILFDYRSYKKE